MGRTEIVAVVPCHNEASNIEAALDRIGECLDHAGARWGIVFVDDGSTDDSWAQMSSACDSDSRVTALRLSRRFGKESAILAGIDHADGAAVVVIDADLEHPPTLLPRMVDLWRKGHKVVHARRVDRAPRGWRGLGTRMFNRLVRASSGLELEGATDYKLIDRQVVDIYRGALRERSRFFRGLAEWVGFRRAYVEFETRPAPGRRSRWSPPDLVALALGGLTSFSALPLRLTTILGVLHLAGAAVLSAHTLWMKLAGHAVSGFATVILVQLVAGSMILVSLGVIGEYLARIYEEVKGRPAYLVEDCAGRRVPPVV